MFIINSDGTIHLTRGDYATFEVTAKKDENENYIFQIDDVVRFTVTEKKKCDSVVLTKEVIITEVTEKVVMNLNQTETKLGEIIHKPKDYWYEVVLNPETAPQTIVGYDDNGPKILRLYPEGDDGV